MHPNTGYIVLATGVLTPASGSSDIAPPASGATVTLYTSDPTNSAAGARFKRLILSIYSSAASGTNGLTFEESNDAGANYDILSQNTLAAATYTKYYIAVSALALKVKFVNSANTLTSWRFALLGDTDERAAP